MPRVNALMLGHSTATVDGNVALVMPGLSAIFLRNFPGDVFFAGAYTMEFAWSEGDRALTVELDIIDETEKTLRVAGQPAAVLMCGFKSDGVDFPNEAVHTSQTFMTQPVRVPKPGWYFVRISIDGHEAKRTELRLAYMKDTALARKAKLGKSR